MVDTFWICSTADFPTMGVSDFRGLLGWLNGDLVQEFVQQFDGGGALVFGALVFCATLLFVPITVFAIISGSLFGPLTGSALITSSATLASVAAFRIGRFVARRKQWRAKENGRLSHWVRQIETLLDQRGVQSFFILRNLPHPFILFSYASGLVKTAKTSDFAIATFVTLAIRSVAFVYLGDSLFKGPKALILPTVLIVVITILSFACERRRKRKEAIKGQESYHGPSASSQRLPEF